MRNFRTLQIWQKGVQLVIDVYKLSGLLPSEEKYGLRSQICRAAVSIPSNIAEGCSRSSEIDYKRFLEIALGSSFELETQFILTKELGFISNDRMSKILSLINEEQKMLSSLITKLKPKPKS